jgi:hypothetical protein
MSPHLVNAILRDYPHLTSTHGQKSNDEFEGFFIEDGWEPLLRRFLNGVDEMRLSLPPEQAAKVKLVCVKEKWAQLRVYLSENTLEMETLLEQIEEESTFVCELCSAPGQYFQPYRQGCVKTLCPTCSGESNPIIVPQG